MFRNATMRLIAAHLVLVAALDGAGARLALLAHRRRHRRRAAGGGGGRDPRPRRRLRPRRHAGARRAPSTSAWRTRPTATPSTCSSTPTAAGIAGNLGRLAADGRARRRLDHARPLPHRPHAPDRDLRARPAPAPTASCCSSAATSPRAPPSTARSGARCSGRSRRSPRSRSPPAGSSRGWSRGRIAEIDGAARAIMAGALDRRVALRGTGDEFDRLAGTLNAMLDRIETLVRDLRTVTDSLAHDLRSPLGRLVRHLEAAADEEAPARRAAGPASSRRCARPRACSPPPPRSSTSRASTPASAPSSSPPSTSAASPPTWPSSTRPPPRSAALTLACDADAGPRGPRARPAPGAGALEPRRQRPEARARRHRHHHRRRARRRRAGARSSATAAPASPRPTAPARSAASSASTRAAAAPAPASASRWSPPWRGCTAPTIDPRRQRPRPARHACASRRHPTRQPSRGDRLTPGAARVRLGASLALDADLRHPVRVRNLAVGALAAADRVDDVLAGDHLARPPCTGRSGTTPART